MTSSFFPLDGPWRKPTLEPLDGPWRGGRAARLASTHTFDRYELLARNRLREDIVSSPIANFRYPTVGDVGCGDDSRWKRWSHEVQMQLLLSDLLRGLAIRKGANALQLEVEWFAQKIIFERPSEVTFKSELQHVLAAASKREERLDEMLMQSESVGSFFAAFIPRPAIEIPATGQLLSAINDATSLLLMQLKAMFGTFRPSEVSSLVQPLIPVPGHGSFPAGHATQAYTASTLLSFFVALLNNLELTNSFVQMSEITAARISENRVVAGLHFTVDNIAGEALGRFIAKSLLTLLANDTEREKYCFLDLIWKNILNEWK
jgi:PAP2 superfamily